MFIFILVHVCHLFFGNSFFYNTQLLIIFFEFLFLIFLFLTLYKTVLDGIEKATAVSGFAAAFAENETMYRENPDYVLSWLTHGLLETEVVTADARALTIARNMIGLFKIKKFRNVVSIVSLY